MQRPRRGHRTQEVPRLLGTPEHQRHRPAIRPRHRYRSRRVTRPDPIRTVLVRSMQQEPIRPQTLQQERKEETTTESQVRRMASHGHHRAEGHVAQVHRRHRQSTRRRQVHAVHPLRGQWTSVRVPSQQEIRRRTSRERHHSSHRDPDEAQLRLRWRRHRTQGATHHQRPRRQHHVVQVRGAPARTASRASADRKPRQEPDPKARWSNKATIDNHHVAPDRLWTGHAVLGARTALRSQCREPHAHQGQRSGAQPDAPMARSTPADVHPGLARVWLRRQRASARRTTRRRGQDGSAKQGRRRPLPLLRTRLHGQSRHLEQRSNPLRHAGSPHGDHAQLRGTLTTRETATHQPDREPRDQKHRPKRQQRRRREQGGTIR